MTRVEQTVNEKFSKAAHNAARVTEGLLLSGASSDSDSTSLQALSYNATSLSEYVVAISYTRLVPSGVRRFMLTKGGGLILN